MIVDVGCWCEDEYCSHYGHEVALDCCRNILFTIMIVMTIAIMIVLFDDVHSIFRIISKDDIYTLSLDNRASWGRTVDGLSEIR